MNDCIAFPATDTWDYRAMTDLQEAVESAFQIMSLSTYTHTYNDCLHDANLLSGGCVNTFWVILH